MVASSCDPAVSAKMNGKNGTARVISDQPLVVIGKMTSSDGLSTAFLGQPSGSKDILMPYVEISKSSSGPQTTVSIMNVSDTSAKNVYITFRYKTKNASLSSANQIVATSKAPLKKLGKYSATLKIGGPALDANGNYLGAAEVFSDQPVVVIVRITQSVTGVPGITTLGEDYTGIPYVP